MQHVVAQGESLSSIATHYGFRDYRIIYNHPNNHEFRRQRPNPNLIYPGDCLHIPDKAAKKISVTTGKRHTFRVPVAKRVLRLRFIDEEGKAITNARAELIPEGAPKIEKTAQSDGQVEFPVPPTAQRATLKLGSRLVQLDLSYLNPTDRAPDDGISGIQGRLHNLGYYDGPIGGPFDRSTRVGLALFQHDHQLNMDGKLDSDTVRHIIEEHGC